MEKIEQNNKTIALNILYVPYNTENVRPAYISKYNNERDKQVILLMITDNKRWHYLAVKSISELLRRITSNHDGYFFCLNCFHSYATKDKLKKHEKVFKEHDFCNIKMPDDDNKILKYNPGKKIIKTSFYYLYRFRMYTSKNIYMSKYAKKLYTENKAVHVPSG